MSRTLDNDQLFGFLSAALISVGGLMGFIKRSSVASLVAGMGSGLLLGYGVNSRNYRLVTGVAAVLFLVMGNRFVRSGRFMPAGLVTLLSSGLLWRFGSKLL
ncbi:hypothetical protein JCM3765_000289 [Sporobolomyces pararoseus]